MKKYSLWNNLRWYFANLRKSKPALAWTASGIALNKAAAALLGVFTPALLVGAITDHATLSEFAWLASLTGLGLVLTSEVDYLLLTSIPLQARSFEQILKWTFTKSSGSWITIKLAVVRFKNLPTPLLVKA